MFAHEVETEVSLELSENQAIDQKLVAQHQPMQLAAHQQLMLLN